MKKQITTIIKLITLTYLFVLSTVHAQWPKHIISDELPMALGPAVADINGDGIPDVVATSYRGNLVVWYEAPEWTPNTIDNLKQPGDVHAADLDNDGDIDVIVPNLQGNVYWYEAPEWTKHSIGAGILNPYITVADINGDDMMDVIGCGKDAGNLVLFQNNLPDLTWTEIPIDGDLDSPQNPSIADINGDEHPDIILPLIASSDVVWYESPGFNKNFIFDGTGRDPRYAHTVDINNDNLLDVVVSCGYGNSGEILWFEAPSWNMHFIDSASAGARCVKSADLNKDGVADIFVTGKESGEVVWYEGPEWTKNIIDNNLPGARMIEIEDMDRDNDLDVVVGAENSNKVLWYENIINEAYIFSSNVYPAYIPPQGDTLFISSSISNVESHPAEVYALITNEDNTYRDSTALYDDGLHGDAGASDNIYAGKKWFSNQTENFYTVQHCTDDLTSGNTHIFSEESHFTTAGPIKIESFDTVKISENSIGLMNFTLRNDGSEKTAQNIVAELKTECDCVTDIKIYKAQFGDLDPGDIKTRIYAFLFHVDDEACIDTAEFYLEISSIHNVYWVDTVKLSEVTDLEDELTELPDKFVLEQNFPNPFNPTTTINYSIPSNAKSPPGRGRPEGGGGLLPVELVVYNILGKQVATLVNKHQRPGNYEVKWDASALTSGVYFYKIQSGEFVSTKKMLLVK